MGLISPNEIVNIPNFGEDEQSTPTLINEHQDVSRLNE